MNEEAAYLVVEQGPYLHQQYLLNQPAVVIGRGPNNDIVFVDAEVSRQHTRILWEETQGYTLQDLGSTNGTFVNGRRISGTVPLQDGDRVNLGESITLAFHLPQSGTLDEDDTPTGELVVPPPPVHEPVQQPDYAAASPPAAPAQPAYVPPQPPAYTPPVAEHVPAADAPPSRRRFHPALIGCGVVLLLVVLCIATLFFLDAYQNGRLLYCGGLRPFWETILGPFGFAPLCG
ncbi:MAG: FHA domain-containing protein [Anaerolineales bacterium]|nr:FHA domain-containing protein [Anaerolineales bacterium]